MGMMDLLKEETMQRILTEKQIQGLTLEVLAGQAGILDPAMLSAICSRGMARKFFEVGDIIEIPWTNTYADPPVSYDYPFVVVHIGDAYDPDGMVHHDALWLMAYYAEPFSIYFDRAEAVEADTEVFLEGVYYYTFNGSNYDEQTVTPGAPIPEGTTYYVSYKSGRSNMIRYGDNRWSLSSIRVWLNSEAESGAGWWVPQHPFDKEPGSTAANYPGWIAGFPEEWRAIFKPVRVQTRTMEGTEDNAVDTTYDRFFLPSVEQVYGMPDYPGLEGEYWEWWKDETGLDSPSNGSSSDLKEARKIYAINNQTGSTVFSYLRTGHKTNGGTGYYFTANGYIHTRSVGTGTNTNKYCCQPCTVLY